MLRSFLAQDKSSREKEKERKVKVEPAVHLVKFIGHFIPRISVWKKKTNLCVPESVAMVINYRLLNELPHLLKGEHLHLVAAVIHTFRYFNFHSATSHTPANEANEANEVNEANEPFFKINLETFQVKKRWFLGVMILCVCVCVCVGVMMMMMM